MFRSPLSPTRNVVSGTTYYYVVSAVSSFGEGSNSIEAAVAPCNVPGAPTNVVTTPGLFTNCRDLECLARRDKL